MSNHDDRIHDGVDESFPASDPPSFTPGRAGSPGQRPEGASANRERVRPRESGLRRAFGQVKQKVERVLRRA